MIVCNKCQGKVFVDLTFTENTAYEAFCLRCGKRDFIGRRHPMYELIHSYVSGEVVLGVQEK